MREIRYRNIADDLRRRVRDGEFVAGRVLPSEAAMSAHYDVSRVTVRRALEMLRDEGILESRQGFGWLVAADPLRQDLSRLGTIEQRLASAGIRSERRILSFGFESTPARVASILGCRRALEVTRLHLADGDPFARVTVWCAESIGAGLSWADVERTSFLEQLPVRIGGATQTIGAATVTTADAGLLGVPRGSAVLTAERVTRDDGGRSVMVSEHIFPAHRTEFVVELPADDATMLPTGLRLVE